MDVMIRRRRTPRRREASKDTTQFLVGLAAVTRTIRTRDKLSQAEVARRAGLGTKFVSAVENGRANPTVRHMGQLAEGLGLAGAAELASRAEGATRRIADATTWPIG
ncbi:MAG: helix-turn-helix transcriptional regulator [Conexibacter sp.]